MYSGKKRGKTRGKRGVTTKAAPGQLPAMPSNPAPGDMDLHTPQVMIASSYGALLSRALLVTLPRWIPPRETAKKPKRRDQLAIRLGADSRAQEYNFPEVIDTCRIQTKGGQYDKRPAIEGQPRFLSLHICPQRSAECESLRCQEATWAVLLQETGIGYLLLRPLVFPLAWQYC